MMVVVKRFLVAAALVLLAASVASARMVSVNCSKANIRSGPGTRYAAVWELGEGFPLKVIGSRRGWLKVIDFEHDVGWIYGRLVGRAPHMVVKKRRINIRSGPGRRYRVVGKADYGVVFRTLARRHGWVKVRHENDLTGWIKRSLLWGW